MPGEQGPPFPSHTAVLGMLSAQRWMGKEVKKGTFVPKPPVPKPQEPQPNPPPSFPFQAVGNLGLCDPRQLRGTGGPHGGKQDFSGATPPCSASS